MNDKKIITENLIEQAKALSFEPQNRYREFNVVDCPMCAAKAHPVKATERKACGRDYIDITMMHVGLACNISPWHIIVYKD